MDCVAAIDMERPERLLVLQAPWTRMIDPTRWPVLGSTGKMALNACDATGCFARRSFLLVSPTDRNFGCGRSEPPPKQAVPADATIGPSKLTWQRRVAINRVLLESC